MRHGICPEGQLADCQRIVRESERQHCGADGQSFVLGSRVLQVVCQVCVWLLLLIIVLPWS